MLKLKVYVEINASKILVGTIQGNNYEDACFQYDSKYFNSKYARSISISLPLKSSKFDCASTKNYFDGLLPEGFTRMAISNLCQHDVNDYVYILKYLGSECLGAILIIEETDDELEPHYKKLSNQELENLAKEGSKKSASLLLQSHLSLAGASGKVGLYFDGRSWYSPSGTAPSTHIVKQSNVNYEDIILNEQLCMKTAEKLGIEVPNSFIVNTDKSNKNILFATQRFDRKFCSNIKIDSKRVPNRLHQEDFAQAMGVPSSQKYDPSNNYLSQMFDLVFHYCSNPISDAQKLLNMIIFNYLIGNTDGHIKNFSLLYDENLDHIRLAPAYDIVSRYCYDVPGESIEDAQFAILISGEKSISKICKNSFLNTADDIRINKNIIEKCYTTIEKNFKNALIMSADELYNEGFSNVKHLSQKILKHTNV